MNKQATSLAPVKLGKPTGVGMGVAFMWALGGQMLTGIVLVLLFGANGFSTQHAQRGMAVILVLGDLVALGLCVAIGEGLRSGRKWAWWIVVVLTSALALGGVLILPRTAMALGNHDGWALWPQIILLTLAPFIAYRLLQPTTRTWYDGVTLATARARHNAPAWFATIIASAAVGGALTAIFERLG